jgi:phenylacetate-CoA ligase
MKLAMFPWNELKIFIEPRTYLYLLEIYPRALLACVRQWDERAIHKTQKNKLSRLVQHAFSQTDYYSQIARECGITAQEIQFPKDLRTIPTLPKEKIRQSWRELCAISAVNGPIYTPRTSGTSGAPITIFTSRHSIDIQTAVTRIRANLAMQVGFAQRILWVSHFKTAGMLAFHTGFHIYLFEQLERLLEDPSVLLEASPAVIIGHPFDLRKLGENIRHMTTKPRLKAVITTYDLLDPATRRYLKESYGCEVYEVYAMAETSCDVAWECPMHRGLHINSDYLVVEILKPNTDEPAATNEVGEVVVTDLHNYVMPLIRYRTGDMARLEDINCDCGRKLPRLTRIEGRLDGAIWSSEHRCLTTYEIIEQLNPLGVGQVEIIQTDSRSITVKYLRDLVDEKTLSLLQRKFADKVGNEIHAEWMPVNALERTSTGKFLTTRSRLG